METRTVWTVRYHNSNGVKGKAEYFCETAQKARQMFRNHYKASAGYKILSVLDWREDMKKNGRD